MSKRQGDRLPNSTRAEFQQAVIGELSERSGDVVPRSLQINALRQRVTPVACVMTIGVIIAFVTGCTARSPVSLTNTGAAPFTGDAFELAKQGGCIGKVLDACLTNLKIGYQFAPYQNIDDSIRRNAALDVTGKRISKKNILSIVGNLKGWDTPGRLGSVALTYTDDKVVNYVEISLPGDPALANTEDDYRKTGLYEGMVLLLGTACPTIERPDVYRFFQATVKPRIVREGKKVEFHDTNAETRNFAKTPAIPFCGLSLTYTNLFGVDTDYISETNTSGVYFRTAIAFDSEPNSPPGKKSR